MDQQNDDGVRLAKYLAARTPLSRRDAEEAIFSGRVTVDHIAVTTPAFFVYDKNRVHLDCNPVCSDVPTPKLWYYHKPPGFLVTKKDPWGRETIFSHLQTLEKKHHRIIYVGRLDKDSEGLLLLTTSPSLASFLEHPRHAFVRQYHVTIMSPWTIDETKKKLQHIEKGITVNNIRYHPCSIKIIFSSPSNFMLHISLKEGKKREIRVLLDSIGIKVITLKRIGYGPFALDNLAPSTYKAVDNDKMQVLLSHIKTHPEFSKNFC